MPLPRPFMRRAIRHLWDNDPVMRGIIARVGPYRIAYAEPDFETLARCIVLQQLSGKAAKAIFARLKGAVTANARMQPSEVLGQSPEALRGLGLSRGKARYLHALAEEVEAGRLDLASLHALPDAEVIAQLTTVKGIGIWTAQMYLMFALRRPDVLAVGDLGIRAAVKKAYRLRTLPDPKRVLHVGRAWHPFASAACWYLWRSLEDAVGL